jgi:hypothetical protein
MKLIPTRPYEASVAKVLTEQERAEAEAEILNAPLLWPVIPGSGGLRKARAARGGRGKSGGARIIYFFVASEGVYLLFAYAKADRENVAATELRRLRALAEAARREH